MLTLAFMAGCAPAHFNFKAHPQLQEKITSIKTIAIVPPRIKVYQLSADGHAQLMDESTAAAKQIVATAVEKELSHHSGFVFKPLPAPSAIPDTSSIPTAARVQDEPEDALALFDYSLGPEVRRLATLANADALLFISGADTIPTTGRTVAFLLFSPRILGIHLWGLQSSTFLSVELVDAWSGERLWHNSFDRSGIVGHHLANPQRVADMLERVFKDFPGSGRPTRNE